MKILVFYQYFGTPAGSWSTRIYELTRRWVAAGHEVTVVTAPYEKSDIVANGFISRSKVDGINLVIINSGDSNRDSFFKRAFKALIFSLTSCYMSFTIPCDVVIASSGPITVGLPALMAKWVRGKKMIFEIRDLWPQGAIELGKISNPLLKSIALWFESICYNNASLVVACSKGMEESVNKRFPEVPTIVISNASDTKLFERTTNTEFKLPDYLTHKKIFVYAGSLGLMDHGALMTGAMQLINDPAIQLIIIGDGAERKSLEAEVRNAGLSNILFLGLIPKNEVVNWLGHAEAALVLFKNYPVLQTSSPNKLFDAFAAGIPVIQNTTGWIKDLFDMEQCGISVSPDSTHELADAIKAVASDLNYRALLSHNSKLLSETIFSRDVLAANYLDAIKRIAS